MSPILTRPVREQLEHDRVIRLLQVRYKKKFDAIINPTNEQNQSIQVGDLVVYPDLLLFAEGSRRLVGTVEVETGESVNSIEARAEWGVYSKLKVPLHLYVPPTSVDTVRRICDEYQIVVSELWTYATAFGQVRFTLVHRSPDAPVVKVPAAAARPTGKPKTAPPAKPKAAAKAAKKPAAKAKSKAKPAARKPVKAKAKPKPERSRGAKGGKKRR